LTNIHDAVEHRGKRPRRAAASADTQAQMIHLRREMEEAIEREDYERASEIRDELRHIEETGRTLQDADIELNEGDAKGEA
jgi:protein arginine kinase activator